MAQAAAFDALIVLRGVVAGDGRFFQRDAEMFLYEVAGGEDGQEGIPLAAARAADSADPPQGLRGHLVGQCKGLAKFFLVNSGPALYTKSR